MKIVKKNLKFDMVLDGEKINSLEELREHPSTELLDLQQDGRLSRWVRAHGGTNEVDQLSALSLSGDKAQDLYAICQILSIDIELEDIKYAFEEEYSCHNKIEKISSDKDIEFIAYSTIDEQKIKEGCEIFFDILTKIITSTEYIILKYIQNYEQPPIYTNISSFFSEKHRNKSPYLSGEEYYNKIKDIKHIMLDGTSSSNNRSIIIDGDEINIYEINSNSYGRIARFIFIKGNNVTIHTSKIIDDSIIFISANNIFIDNLGTHNILIGNNIFINYYEPSNILKTSFICAKNILSIGKSFDTPPFLKSNEELISDNISIERNYESNKDIFLSASTYLYGCEKCGTTLDSELAVLYYERIIKIFNNWIEFKKIFEPKFWKLNDEDIYKYEDKYLIK